ncbi:MAG: tetratricopeptide repeat protein, partial [Bacteroidales bacterium]
REEELRLARAATQAQLSSNFSNQTSGKWYFYNPQVIAKGNLEFKRIWGTRSLADNWRQNKNNAMDFSNTEKPDTLVKKNPLFTPEYYLVNVPISDSMIRASDSMVLSAMFDASLVYKDYLNDKPAAIKMLEAMNKRFSTHRYQLETFFYLYIANTQVPNTARAEYYKNILISNYPNELLTKYVIDPNFVSDQEIQIKAANSLFEKALANYHQDNYSQARRLAEQGYNQYNKMPIAANFKLLYTMADAQNNSIPEYIAALTNITQNYKNTEVAQVAQNMINTIKTREQLIIEEQNTKPIIAEVPNVEYSLEDEKSIFVLIFDKNINHNQLKFNFIAFNADINADEYSVDIQNFNNKLQILTVSGFKNITSALSYHKKIAQYPTIFRDLNITKVPQFFAITQSNLKLLEKSGIVELYQSFFERLLDL